jgi:hypothetical protein
MKINPEKCVFRVKKGKFLACLVSTKGIEANSHKNTRWRPYFEWNHQNQGKGLGDWQTGWHP